MLWRFRPRSPPCRSDTKATTNPNTFHRPSLPEASAGSQNSQERTHISCDSLSTFCYKHQPPDYYTAEITNSSLFNSSNKYFDIRHHGISHSPTSLRRSRRPSHERRFGQRIDGIDPFDGGPLCGLEKSNLSKGKKQSTHSCGSQ